MSEKRNAEQVSEAILKAVLRKDPNEQVIGDVTAWEIVQLIAGNFTSCPACGAEPWTNLDCRVCDAMGIVESEPRVDPVAAERLRCAQICADHAASMKAAADKYPGGTSACFVEEALELERRMRQQR